MGERCCSRLGRVGLGMKAGSCLTCGLTRACQVEREVMGILKRAESTLWIIFQKNLHGAAHGNVPPMCKYRIVDN